MIEWLIGALVVAALVWAGLIFNGLVRRRNRVDATWSDIDVLLRRRHDLVPDLVSTVQGYSTHESQVLRQVTDLRAAAVTAQGPADRGEAETALTGGVKTVLAVAEAYPDLKASKAFLELQQQLTATEDGLEHVRQFYNDAVYGYNNAIQTLPGSLIAGATGFHARQFFQAQAGERTTPQVST